MFGFRNGSNYDFSPPLKGGRGDVTIIVKCFITSPLTPFKGGIWRHVNVKGTSKTLIVILNLFQDLLFFRRLRIMSAMTGLQ